MASRAPRAAPPRSRRSHLGLWLVAIPLGRPGYGQLVSGHMEDDLGIISDVACRTPIRQGQCSVMAWFESHRSPGGRDVSSLTCLCMLSPGLRDKPLLGIPTSFGIGRTRLGHMWMFLSNRCPAHSLQISHHIYSGNLCNEGTRESEFARPPRTLPCMSFFRSYRRRSGPMSFA